MNIYRILFSQTGPKSQEEGIKTYLLAENDEQVYEYVDEKYNYGCWKDTEEDEEEPSDVYDDDYNVIGTETFKEQMIRIKGEINDENYDFSDAYYGITLLGWELVEEDTNLKLDDMIKLGIIETIK